MSLLGADWLIPPSPLSPYLHFKNGERPRGFSARIRVIRDSCLSIRVIRVIRGCSLFGCGRRPRQDLCDLCVFYFFQLICGAMSFALAHAALRLHIFLPSLFFSFELLASAGALFAPVWGKFGP